MDQECPRLAIEVITRDATGAQVGNTREFNLYDHRGRAWMAKHCWWAAHEGFTVTSRIAGAGEPSGDDRTKRALAELTDCFLEKHGCFPLDNTKWRDAMTEAYALIGQPNTAAREAAFAPGATAEDGARVMHGCEACDGEDACTCRAPTPTIPAGTVAVIKRLEALMAKATKRPWRVFDGGAGLLAIMKGDRPSVHSTAANKRWAEIVKWAGFDGTDVGRRYDNANAELMVEAVNALPEMIATLRSLAAAPKQAEQQGVEWARLFSEWHEDDGDVLWWKLPIMESPYCGSPLDLGRGMKVTVQIGFEEHEMPIAHTSGWPFTEEDEPDLWWSPLPSPTFYRAAALNAPTGAVA